MLCSENVKEPPPFHQDLGKLELLGNKKVLQSLKRIKESLKTLKNNKGRLAEGFFFKGRTIDLTQTYDQPEPCVQVIQGTEIRPTLDIVLA